MTDRAQNYFQYRSDLQKLCLFNKFKPSPDIQINFYLPLSDTARKEMVKPVDIQPFHQKRPDIDNLVKGFLDSLYEEDCTVWHIDAYKWWTHDKMGRIEVLTP